MHKQKFYVNNTQQQLTCSNVSSIPNTLIILSYQTVNTRSRLNRGESTPQDLIHLISVHPGALTYGSFKQILLTQQCQLKKNNKSLNNHNTIILIIEIIFGTILCKKKKKLK
jgi:hypothetical protein